MQEKLLNLQEAALNEIKDTSSIEAVESLRVKYLGKKGEITAILKEMGKLSASGCCSISSILHTSTPFVSFPKKSTFSTF